MSSSRLLYGLPVKRKGYNNITANVPTLPLYMFAGGGGGGATREENLILPRDQGPVTVLQGSVLEALLEVLHLVGELVGPHTGTEDQTGAAEHQDCQHQG